MADILSISSIVLFVLSFIFLLMSIFIWKKYNIPEVYGDWSGKTARRSLERMYEEKNKITKKKKTTRLVEKSKKVNVQPVNSTEAITGLVQENVKHEEFIPETTYLYDQETALLQDEETQLLINNHDFKVLSQVMIVHTNETI